MPTVPLRMPASAKLYVPEIARFDKSAAPNTQNYNGRSHACNRLHADN